MNAVFLLALCFSILVESLKRLVKVEEIEKPSLLLIVGATGLLVNVIGLFMFHNQVHGELASVLNRERCLVAGLGNLIISWRFVASLRGK